MNISTVAAMVEVDEHGARYNGEDFEPATGMKTVLFKDDPEVGDCLMIFVSNDSKRLAVQIERSEAMSVIESLQELLR